MDNTKARIRINFSTHEFEFEGSETFITKYLDKFEDVIESFKGKPITKSTPGKVKPEGIKTIPLDSEVPEKFGEYLQKYSDTSDVNKVLIAAYFAELKSDDKTFKTAEADMLLKEQSIKVANPSACIKMHLDKKRIFVHAKHAKKENKYKVSKKGKEFLDTLLAS